MQSFDTNILLPAVEVSNPQHEAAFRFLESIQTAEDVIVSEFVLLELYLLLRNPAVVPKPLSANKAVEICEAYRQHPRWRLVGFPSESRALHDRLWPYLRSQSFGRRRIFDARIALCLQSFGVTAFATANLKDFEGFGFERVWNPLATQASES